MKKYILKKKIGSILSLIIMVCISGKIFSQDCTALASYRDNQLFTEYDKAFNKYTLNQESRDYVTGLKNELLNDTRWNTSDAGFSVAVISQFIKTTCNFVGNMLRFNPAVGVAGTVMDNTVTTAQRVYDGIKTGKTIYSIVSGSAEKTGYGMVLSKAGTLGQVIKTAWDLAQDIDKMGQLDADRTRLKKDVKTALENIELEMARYDQVIQASVVKIKEINEIKNGIDKYLAEKCK